MTQSLVVLPLQILESTLIVQNVNTATMGPSLSETPPPSSIQETNWVQEGVVEVYNHFPYNQSRYIGQISKLCSSWAPHIDPFTRASAQVPWVGSGLRGPTAVASLG